MENSAAETMASGDEKVMQQPSPDGDAVSTAVRCTDSHIEEHCPSSDYVPSESSADFQSEDEEQDEVSDAKRRKQVRKHTGENKH